MLSLLIALVGQQIQGISVVRAIKEMRSPSRSQQRDFSLLCRDRPNQLLQSLRLALDALSHSGTNASVVQQS